MEKAIKLIAAIPDADIDDEDNDDSKKPIDTTTLDKNINDFNLPTGSSEKLSNLLKNVLQAKVSKMNILILIFDSISFSLC